MTRRDDLITLRDKVKADDEFEWIFATRIVGIYPDNRHVKFMRAKKGSVDAALAFLAAVLPGFHPGMSRNIHTEYWYAWVQTKEKHFDSHEETPARALLLATLNALIAEDKTNG